MDTTKASPRQLRRWSDLWTTVIRPSDWPIFSALNNSSNGRFRVRDPERDRNTDRDRSQRLIGLLEQLGREVKSERDGLAARLKVDTGDAAFLMDVVDNDDAAKSELNRVDTLERAIVHAEARIRSLDDYLKKLQTITAFSRSNFDNPPTAPGIDVDPEGLQS